MAKTAAQRQAERRAKMKANPAAYEAFKLADRVRKQEQKNNMTAEERVRLKKKTKQAVQRHRLRAKKQKENEEPADVSVTTGTSSSAYKTPQTLGKAKRRVLQYLPKSPTKKRQVTAAIASEVLQVQLPFTMYDKNKKRGLSSVVLEKVQSFYNSEYIAHVLPGKADYVTVRENGIKKQMQKKVMLMTISEAFEIFRTDNPDVSIGKSKFAELRPENVMLTSKMPQNVCGCIYHSNIILLIDPLHRKFPEIVPLYSKNEFLSLCVCDTDNENCMSGNCALCQDQKMFDENIQSKTEEFDEDELKYYQWVDVDGYLQKKLSISTVKDAFQLLKVKLPQFMWHTFIKSKQENAYKQNKDEAQNEDSTKCLLQMDFAENYTCQWQDEVQSAHWNQKQITIYTIMIYFRKNTLSWVIVSDNRDHSKRAVSAFTSIILKKLRVKFDVCDEVSVWTDGPSSQYKNRYIFALTTELAAKYSYKISWNYFATSHGKGPNDALGGNIKRIAYRKVMSRNAVINSAETFVAAVVSPNIFVFIVTEDQINQECQYLDVESLWSGLPAIPGTINTHYIEPSASCIVTKFYTHSETVNGVYELKCTGTKENIQSKPGRRNVTKTKVAYRCKQCGKTYGDPDDPKKQEDWLKCASCSLWFHETCAENYGIIDDSESFTCLACM